MKIIKFIFILFLLLSIFQLNAKPKKSGDDSLFCLKVKGTVVADKKEGIYVVMLYKDSVKVDSVMIHHWHKDFHFYLDRNAIYEIKISREGYQSKIICIDTSIPIDKELMFEFHFRVKLLTNKILDLLNKAASIGPIALVYYNAHNNSFCYTKSSNKTSAIQSKLLQ